MRDCEGAHRMGHVQPHGIQVWATQTCKPNSATYAARTTRRLTTPSLQSPFLLDPNVTPVVFAVPDASRNRGAAK